MKEFFSFLKSLGFFLAIALLLRASVVEAFRIPSSSMESTLTIGDHILVNKLSYGIRLPLVTQTVYEYGEPERGNIVVFTLPDDPATTDVDESDINIIKRVVGLPGEIVEVRGTNVFINGKLLEDDHLHSQWLRGGVRDFGPVQVPPHHVLLLGDNRDFSRDSRYWDDPFLDISRIKGRAFFIYWNSKWRLDRIFDVIR